MPTRDSKSFIFFFFNDTATTEIYTLSLHDALPIYLVKLLDGAGDLAGRALALHRDRIEHDGGAGVTRSEEHTSELQSQSNLVCRLLLEKKQNDPRFVPMSCEPSPYAELIRRTTCS